MSDKVWIVFNADYVEVKSAHLWESEAQDAAVEEHNRLYDHNGPESVVYDYEELNDTDSPVMVLGPATLHQ